MGIYDSIKNQINQIKSLPKKLLGDRNLKKVVKKMKDGPKSAKQILYDFNENIVGILQQNDEPFIFSEPQIKEFVELLKDSK